MSGFTITAGVSFSGGFTFTEAPVENTAAWFGGGFAGTVQSNVISSTVDRITYATDTATTTGRGPLSSARYSLAATGNSYDGWFAGGHPGPVSRVDRITYATDTATASVRGPLSQARGGMGAASNATDGWFGGGTSTVDRITYASDTTTATARGPLSSARGGIGAAGNTTDGWFGGGGPGPGSTVDQITYANDTNTASVRGPLSLGAGGVAAAGNTTNAWFGGGYVGSPIFTGYRSYVQRITFATDTATASVRGPLSSARYSLAAAGNTTDGWFGAGEGPSPPSIFYTSRIDRITYATDTVTASVRGSLNISKRILAAAGGMQ